MVEWFKAHAWKACDVRASAGSNPVLCAICGYGEMANTLDSGSSESNLLQVQVLLSAPERRI